MGLFPPSDLETFNGRGPKWHFIPIQRPRRVASWKMSWIHGAKTFIPWRKEEWQVFSSQYIDVIKILYIFGRKKGKKRDGAHNKRCTWPLHQPMKSRRKKWRLCEAAHGCLCQLLGRAAAASFPCRKASESKSPVPGLGERNITALPHSLSS